MPAAERYPLHWPDGWPRTPAHRRQRSRYKVGDARARDELPRGLDLMGARGIILSTNIQLRQDGLPYAGRRTPDDPGVAVYWTSKSGQELVVASDQYQTVRENMRAIGLTIEAFRAIDRAGCADILERAYRGFAALPATVTPAPRSWRVVLGYAADATPSLGKVIARYRRLARERHPDRGGSHEAMAELNDALERAKAELG